jgi:hypothetical protein
VSGPLCHRRLEADDLSPVILEGAVTAFVGIAVYFVLPSYPDKCTFFNDEQRRLSVWRTTQDAMGEADEGETSLKKGAKLVFKDWKASRSSRARVQSTYPDAPQILMLIFQQMFISCSQSFTYFFPTIVKTLGFGANETLLLTAPPYLFAFFCSVAVAYSSSRFEERGFHIAIPMVSHLIR